MSTSVSTIKLAFNELLKVCKEYTTSWWEVQSLENYIKQSIVPRGLRVSLQPSERVKSETLKVKWEKEATSSSLRFMRLLLEEEKITLQNLTKKLEDQIDTTLKFRSDPDFEAKEVDLQSKLIKHQAYIKQRKHSLFLRDSVDFKEGRAYVFPSRGNNNKFKGGDTDISSSEAELSEPERGGSFKNQRGRPPNTRSKTKQQGWGRGLQAQGASSSGSGTPASFLGQQR